MRILLLPDDVTGGASGSFSARATIRQLRSLGHSVGVIDRAVEAPFVDSKGVRFFGPPTALRWYEHYVSPALRNWFLQVCDDFQPDYYVMVGNIQKPAMLARLARSRGIKTAFLFYMNDFYCSKIYSGLASGPCTACARFPELPAFRNNCAPMRHWPHFVKGALIRAALKREILRADRVLGYGQDQNTIYELFGVKRDALRVIGFQFDPSDLDDVQPRDGDYFAVVGQPLMQKGFHVLADILSRLDGSVRVSLSIPNPQSVDRVMSQFGLGSYVTNGRLNLVTGLRSRARYIDFIAECRGLIMPSYYPTTGEFVLQEALYLGKPVIAFGVGVHKDILRNGDNAMVSAVGDFDAFAGNIQRINENAELRRMIGTRAKEASRRFYDRSSVDLWSAALT